MSTFTPDELATLAFAKEQKMDIVNSIMREGVPKDNEDLKVLLQALGSLDTTIMQTARVRLQDEENDTAKANTEVLTRLLRLTRPETFEIGSRTQTLEEIPETDVVGIEILDGELTDTSSVSTKEEFEDIIEALKD
jgi:hypothetical protein